MLIASIAGLLAACQTANDQARDAAAREAAAKAVAPAIAATREIPPLPADCRRTERSGVKEGDRWDVAVVKSDAAIGRLNERIKRCAAWHDGIRERPKE